MSQNTTKKIVIVGAGPAGLLLAHNLIRRPNYEITIVERRSDPRQQPVQQTRSFPVSLQFRGRNALELVGIDITKKKGGVFLNAVELHNSKKRSKIIPKDPPNFSIDRNHIIMALLEDLEASQQRHATTTLNAIQFDSLLKRVDLDNRKIIVSVRNEESAIPFDHLVAADGSRSRIRKELSQMNKLIFQEKDIPDDYRTIHLSEVGLDSDKLHGWMFDDGSKIIAAPIHKGCVSGAFIFSKETDPFTNCQNPQDVLDFFAGLTPSVRSLITLREATDLLQRPTASLVSVKCDRLHSDDGYVVLLGDSAHALSPSLGQGCNAALQDVQIFAQLLDLYQDDWTKVLPAYSNERLVDAHAVTELSDYSTPRSKWMKLEWVLRQILRSLFPLWLSALLLRPLPMDLLLDEKANLSYSQVLEKSKWWLKRVKKTQQE